MKINLGNKILNVQLRIFKEPNKEKLKKELSDYFSENKIEGMRVKDFEINGETFSNVIIPKEPYFENFLSGGNYEKDLKQIGNKYRIENFGFVYWCYGK